MNETFRFVIGLVILVSAGFAAGDVWQAWQDEQANIEAAQIRMNESVRHPDVVQRLIGLARVRDDVAQIYADRKGVFSMVVSRAALPIEQDARRAFDDNLQHCLTREKKDCAIRLAVGLGQQIPNSWQRDLAAVEIVQIMLDWAMYDDAELVVNTIQDPILQAWGYEQLAQAWPVPAAIDGAAVPEEAMRRRHDFWQRAVTAVKNIPAGIDRLNSTAFLITSLWQQDAPALKAPEFVKPLVVAAITGMEDQPAEMATAIAWLQLIAAAAPYGFADLNQQMLEALDKINLPEAQAIKLQARAIALAPALVAGVTPELRARLAGLSDVAERALMLAVLVQFPVPEAELAAARADMDLAIQSARLLPPDQMMPELVVEMTAAFAALGYVDQANDMLNRLKPESDFYRDAVMEVGRYLVRAQKLDEARTWLARLPTERIQARRLGDIIANPTRDVVGSDLAWRVGRLFYRTWMTNAKAQEEFWQEKGVYRQVQSFAAQADAIKRKKQDNAAPAAQGDTKIASAIEGDMAALVDKTMAITEGRGPIAMPEALQDICPPQSAASCPIDALYMRAWVMRRLVLPALQDVDNVLVTKE